MTATTEKQSGGGDVLFAPEIGDAPLIGDSRYGRLCVRFGDARLGGKPISAYSKLRFRFVANGGNCDIVEVPVSRIPSDDSPDSGVICEAKNQDDGKFVHIIVAKIGDFDLAFRRYNCYPVYLREVRGIK